MLSKTVLEIFACSLIRIAKQSDEMKKEVKNFNEQRLSFFNKILDFNFANYNVRLCFSPTPEICKNYEIRDRKTNALLISRCG